MLHDQIVAEIQTRAETRGVLTHYCGSSVRCTGHRGKPDLFLVGRYGAAWIEVKRPGDELRPDQTTWKHTLIAADQTYLIAVESHLHDGRIDNLINGLTCE